MTRSRRPHPPRQRPDHRVLDARPRRHHHHARRPRRRRHQGRAAVGRLHPADDVADRRGHVADAPPHQPRQAVDHHRPAHRGRARGVPRARARRRRRDRGHAPRRARQARRRLRGLQGRQPADRVLHDLRLRHDRPLQGHAEPRHRLRRVGRPRRSPRSPTTASASSPSTPRSASTPVRCSVRSACSPASPGRGPRASRAASRSRSPTRPRPWTGCAARRGRPTSGPSPRSPATRPTTTSAARPGTAGMRDGVRYQFYETSDGHILFMASEREFWENFCNGVGRPDLFEQHPGSQYADHARGNNELRAELAEIFRSRTTAEWVRLRQRGQHADRAGEHAEDARRRPAVPGPPAVDPARAGRHRPGAVADQGRRRGAARCPPRRRTRGSTPTPCSREVLGYDDARIAELPRRRRARRRRSLGTVGGEEGRREPALEAGRLAGLR